MKRGPRLGEGPDSSGNPLFSSRLGALDGLMRRDERSALQTICRCFASLVGRRRSPDVGSGRRPLRARRRASTRRTFGVLSVAVALFAPLANCSPEGTRCSVADDCWNAPEGQQLGRCFPKDLACVNGTCRIDCAELCEMIDPKLNPCRDRRQICNQSESGRIDHPYCTRSPIACGSAEDCPLFLPDTAGAETARWSCDAGVCRFPGFQYVWE